MKIFSLFFDWFVLLPAGLIDYLIAGVIGVAPFPATLMTWHWTIKFFEPIDPSLGRHDFPGKPREFMTGVIVMFAIMKTTD
jgi:hypothetical protein